MLVTFDVDTNSLNMTDPTLYTYLVRFYVTNYQIADTGAVSSQFICSECKVGDLCHQSSNWGNAHILKGDWWL